MKILYVNIEHAGYYEKIFFIPRKAFFLTQLDLSEECRFFSTKTETKVYTDDN